jgi:hypothetical protein
MSDDVIEAAPTKRRKNGHGATAVAVVEPAPLPAAAPHPMTMLDRAMERGLDGAALEKLIELSERMMASEARRAFDAALAKARAELKPIERDGKVDFTSQKGRTNYTHETLAGIAEAVDPILARHGLSYGWKTTNRPGEPITVTCELIHEAGHREDRAMLSGPADMSGNKNPLQGIGSTVSFLQRYTLKASLGLSVAKDDDGRAGGGRHDDDAPPPREERKPEPAPKREPVSGAAAQQVVEMYAGQLRAASTAAAIKAVCDEFVRNYKGRMHAAHLAKIEEIAEAELKRVEAAHGDAYTRLAAELRACKTRGEVVAVGATWKPVNGVGALDELTDGQRGDLRALFAKLKEELPETAAADPLADVLAYLDGRASVDAVDAALNAYRNGGSLGDAPEWKSLAPADMQRVLDHAKARKAAIAEGEVDKLVA